MTFNIPITFRALFVKLGANLPTFFFKYFGSFVEQFAQKLQTFVFAMQELQIIVQDTCSHALFFNFRCYRQSYVRPDAKGMKLLQYFCRIRSVSIFNESVNVSKRL